MEHVAWSDWVKVAPFCSRFACPPWSSLVGNTITLGLILLRKQKNLFPSAQYTSPTVFLFSSPIFSLFFFKSNRSVLRAMAEPSKNHSHNGNGEEEDDYMGDLSLFLPPAASVASKLSSKKIPSKSQVDVQPSKKRKKLNWQEQRKFDRERKQIEEDKQIIARIEAPIPQSNIGFKLLKQMGYTPGAPLGKEGSGRAEPVGLDIRRSRAGIGREDPEKEKRKREEIEAEKNRRKVEDLLEDFGSRQKSQWRMRRVVMNFKKAKAALDQLENKEVVVPKKSEDEEEGGEEEEEEEEITEEVHGLDNNFIYLPEYVLLSCVLESS